MATEMTILAPADRPLSFYFHYNKPASLKAGRVQISVHVSGTCWIVDKVRALVPTESQTRARQPRCVIRGKCAGWWTENDGRTLVLASLAAMDRR